MTKSNNTILVIAGIIILVIILVMVFSNKKDDKTIIYQEAPDNVWTAFSGIGGIIDSIGGLFNNNNNTGDGETYTEPASTAPRLNMDEQKSLRDLNPVNMTGFKTTQLLSV